MRTFFKLALLFAATTLFGCAHNYYNIPQETLEKKVRVIGVAHFFVDADSDIRHPEKGEIVSLLQTSNAKNEKELIARLRETGIFYAVRQVDGDPSRLFAGLLVNRERRDDAGIIYNKYFYKKDELRQLCIDNGLDAIMFMTVSGLTRPEKVFASNYLSYLESDFNYLSITAQMLDRDGNTIWEYPNFRRSALTYPMFFRLQYPDFDEAAANLNEKVDVKFKTVAGVKAAFAQTEPSAIGNAPPVSSLYARQYDEILSLLKTYKPLFGGKKETPAAPPLTSPGVTPAPTMTPKPAIAPRPAAAPVKPVEPAPLTVPKPTTNPDAIPSGDIVPEEPPVK
jgi:hypothetical protein